MFKKTVVIISAFSLFFLCSCSKESKFGIDEFTSRMNENYGTSLDSSTFMLGVKDDESKYFFCENGNTLLTLFPDNNNTIKGISILATDNTDVGKFITYFTEMCAVFTGMSDEEQSAILTNCGISADKIKFTDSNTVNTVGKYKYVSVCNKYSVTLFCERV